MAQYYARVRIEGTSTPQLIEVQASGPSEAKKLIEARLGKVKSWVNSPQTRSTRLGPPSWYK